MFKSAVAALDAAFRGTNTWLVLTIHYAVLLECDAGDGDEVRAMTEAIMKLELRALYPVLDPKVDVNMSDRSCWNKDGDGNSIERFLRDPLAALGLKRGVEGPS